MEGCIGEVREDDLCNDVVSIIDNNKNMLLNCMLW